MAKSGLGGEKVARAISVGNFKHRWNLEMRGQLPDYDEFQGYDLGIDTDLSCVAGNIYANFRVAHADTPFTYGENCKEVISGTQKSSGEW